MGRDLPLCVDARMLGKGGTGVSTYARSLAAAMTALSDRPFRLVADRIDDGRVARWAGALPHTARRVVASVDRDGRTLRGRDLFRRAHIHFDLYRRLMPLRCDLPPGIMHWTYPVPLRLEGWVNLYTVHDAIPLEHPDLTPIDASRHRAVLGAIIRRGDDLTTVSEAARHAIVATLGCAPDRVAVTGQPVDLAGAMSAALPAGLERRGYWLAVGTIEPRKNLTALLAAYRRSGSDLPLVIAGPVGWQAGPILADVAATRGVFHLAYLPRPELLALIAGARALLFPSLVEGFGLPIVEAMALGTPVVTSDRGATAEVAGDAALLVDVADVAGMAGAIARLGTDPALSEALIGRGRVRAGLFSPARFADRLGTLYRAALQRRAGAANPPHP